MALNPGFGLSPYRVVLVTTLVVGAAVAGGAVWSLSRPVPRLPTRFAIILPSRASPAVGQNVAISPDGRTLIYAADQLYRREMAQLSVQPIPGTESAFTPFFSPDGQWVGFSQPGSLKRMPLAGGPSVTLAAATVRGASWEPDDTVVFGGFTVGLSRVSVVGGELEPVTTLGEGETSHRWPDILPSGEAALFTVWSGLMDTAQIGVVSLETGERRTLMSGTSARYSSTGHIIFAREASLWAVPFDAGRLAVTGSPVPVLEGVSAGAGGDVQFSLSDDGTLIYVPATANEIKGGSGSEEPPAPTTINVVLNWAEELKRLGPVD